MCQNVFVGDSSVNLVWKFGLKIDRFTLLSPTKTQKCSALVSVKNRSKRANREEYTFILDKDVLRVLRLLVTATRSMSPQHSLPSSA